MRNFVRSRVYRYGLIYMGLFIASVLIILFSLYLLFMERGEALVDAKIRHEVERITSRYSEADEARMIANLSFFMDVHPGYAGVYLLEDSRGRHLAGNLDHWPDVELVPGQMEFFTHLDRQAKEDSAILVRGTVCLLPGNHRLLVGRNYSIIKDIKFLLRREAIDGLLISIALGLVVSTVMAFSLSRRLERINRTTLETLDAGLDIRVPLNGSGDEFDRLAVNLNRMLGRIKRLMESMEGVADVIAHDLRSPLNRLKSRMEVGLLSDRTHEDYRTILVENVEDTDRILSTFNSLLTIAKVRASSAQVGFQTVDLAEVLRETWEFYTPVAEEKGQVMTVEASDPVPVNGNPDLLVQVMFNLVDNAIKYSPSGALITLTAEKESSVCVVQVRDDGPGIPEHFLPSAFDRFSRLDSHRESSGQGLGLSLVQVVVELHGGSVELVDGGPGLVARLEFPSA